MSAFVADNARSADVAAEHSPFDLRKVCIIRFRRRASSEQTGA